MMTSPEVHIRLLKVELEKQINAKKHLAKSLRQCKKRLAMYERDEYTESVGH